MMLLAALLVASDYVGPVVCGECHAKQYATQHDSHHATSLKRITLDNSKLRTMTERNGATFRYEAAEGGGVRVTTQKGEDVYSTLLEWTFGAGSQATTAVGRLPDGRFFEHRISWFAKPGRLSLTPGHAPAPSQAAEAAVGIIEQPESIYRCFNCHASNVKPGPDVSDIIPAVTCERCHGAGARHVAAARAKQPDVKSTVFNAGRFKSGKAIVAVCGECHRSPNVEYHSELPEIEDPLSVRFAPIGFSVSKCFQRSPNFSCITCHNPHENPKPAADASYTQVCRNCHATPKHKAARAGTCVECHMHKSSPVPNLTFTDHRIRVY